LKTARAKERAFALKEARSRGLSYDWSVVGSRALVAAGVTESNQQQRRKEAKRGKQREHVTSEEIANALFFHAAQKFGLDSSA
jgi:hypothetical protein